MYLEPDSGRQAFFSYSREDREFVKPLARAMEGLGVRVFRDEDHITPGDDWRQSIRAALREAQTVCVCWCRHASASKEVNEEIDLAVDYRKRLLPLLLDSTPMTPALASRQAVDWRPVFGPSHGESADRSFLETPPRPSRSTTTTVVLDKPAPVRQPRPASSRLRRVALALVALSPLLLLWLGLKGLGPDLASWLPWLGALVRSPVFLVIAAFLLILGGSSFHLVSRRRPAPAPTTRAHRLPVTPPPRAEYPATVEGAARQLLDLIR